MRVVCSRIRLQLIGKFLAVIVQAHCFYLGMHNQEAFKSMALHAGSWACLHPEEWAAESYQQMYSMMAIGSGGALGRLGFRKKAASNHSYGFILFPKSPQSSA